MRCSKWEFTVTNPVRLNDLRWITNLTRHVDGSSRVHITSHHGKTHVMIDGTWTTTIEEFVESVGKVV